ncbi:MAG: tetratricopeptide repeat protein [Bacteroidia bacterium]|nr:tetratricopeptide repeat protein [Bacteroidia bacterium]
MKLFCNGLIGLFCLFLSTGRSQINGNFDSSDYYCEKLIVNLKTGAKLEDARVFIVKHKLKERLLKKLNENIEKLNTAEQKFLLYTGLAYSFYDVANFAETQPLLIKALKISEGTKNINYQCVVYNMIGNLFSESGMYESAIANFKRAVRMAAKVNDEDILCTLYGNMSSCFYAYGELHKVFLDSARRYNDLTIKLATKLKKEDDLHLAYQCKGLIETDLENYTDAEIAFRNAIKISSLIDDKALVNYSQYQLARMFINKGDKYSADSALKYLNLAKTTTLDYDDNNLMNEILYEYSRVYELNGDYKKSAYYAIRFAEFNDSLMKQENARASAELSEKYESVKREAQIAELNLSQKEKQAQIDRQLYMIIGSVVILIFVGFAAFSLYRSNQIRKKANQELSEKNILIEAQKEEVEKQKELVDEKNKEILDSIHYAKRIQQSLLPTQKYMERNLTKLKKDDGKG